MAHERRAERYRREGPTALVELRLRTPQQLFDLRDPAPFRERDLDDDAVAYLVEAMEDLRDERDVELRFLFACERAQSALSAEELEAAIRAHFAYEHDRARRQLSASRRQGQATLLVVLPALALVLWLSAQLDHYAQTHPAWKLAREGLTIFGWVLLWNPIDTLLFSGWPIRERARLFRRIERAKYRVLFEQPPPNER